MRLIDADRLIESLQYAYNKQEIGTLDDVASIIDEQPTAYDADKVVEQLKKEKQRYDDIFNSYEFGRRAGFDKAIEIVEAGGVNE